MRWIRPHRCVIDGGGHLSSARCADDFCKEEAGITLLRSFLYYVPYAALGAMTFPGILYSTGDLSLAIAGMSVALLLSFYGKGLLPVAVGAIAAVYAIQFFL